MAVLEAVRICPSKIFDSQVSLGNVSDRIDNHTVGANGEDSPMRWPSPQTVVKFANLDWHSSILTS
jgi:hypothetical protein